MFRHRRFLISLALVAVTAALYLPVRHHDFISFDDKQYILENPVVRNGLTAEGVSWAFRSTYHANWHPLTWVSHMLDVEMFGLDPGRHHLVNLLLHAVNSVLLFLVLARMTGDAWPSGFVAALFAVHPLHVESVAWIAERKDVLSAFFWMMTMWAYARYTERRSFWRYLAVMAFLSLGLMAKPMLVTIPFVLLLMDFWPLKRLVIGGGTSAAAPSMPPDALAFRLLVIEKIPLLLLSAASSAITFAAQTGVDVGRSTIPSGIRIGNALVSYVQYMRKTVYPVSLSIFYPHPGDALTAWQAAVAGAVLLCITLLVLRTAVRRPYLATGWFWYLGTLVPTIGLVQVGHQAMADRYTYIPLIGLFIVIAWGVPEVATRLRLNKTVIASTASAVLIALSAAAYAQVGHWRNNFTIFGHAIAVTRDNWLAHNDLGRALLTSGKVDDAIPHFRETLRIRPGDSIAIYNLKFAHGISRHRLGDYGGAVRAYRELIRLFPSNVEVYALLADALSNEGNIEEAVSQYAKALQLHPGYAFAHLGLGRTLERWGKYEEALFHYREAVRLAPGDVSVSRELESALSRMNR